jgi:hypothetical protein
MMLTFDIDEKAGKFHFFLRGLFTKKGLILIYISLLAEKAHEFITENGKKKMDYNLFNEFMRQFFIRDEPNHPISLGL